jgi:hypothetical protein
MPKLPRGFGDLTLREVTGNVRVIVSVQAMSTCKTSAATCWSGRSALATFPPPVSAAT